MTEREKEVLREIVEFFAANPTWEWVVATDIFPRYVPTGAISNAKRRMLNSIGKKNGYAGTGLEYSGCCLRMAP